jgi:hypothetical protein
MQTIPRKEWRIRKDTLEQDTISEMSRKELMRSSISRGTSVIVGPWNVSIRFNEPFDKNLHFSLARTGELGAVLLFGLCRGLSSPCFSLIFTRDLFHVTFTWSVNTAQT